MNSPTNLPETATPLTPEDERQILGDLAQEINAIIARHPDLRDTNIVLLTIVSLVGATDFHEKSVKMEELLAALKEEAQKRENNPS